jgi:hypothetical protein
MVATAEESYELDCGAALTTDQPIARRSDDSTCDGWIWDDRTEVRHA